MGCDLILISLVFFIDPTYCTRYHLWNVHYVVFNVALKAVLYSPSCCIMVTTYDYLKRLEVIVEFTGDGDVLTHFCVRPHFSWVCWVEVVVEFGLWQLLSLK